uniref:Uncharacterized protein n=1 Tax=Ditylenchus dipsaci TaxID=166011 RepID=A0A915CYV5_9BILA
MMQDYLELEVKPNFSPQMQQDIEDLYLRAKMMKVKMSKNNNDERLAVKEATEFMDQLYARIDNFFMRQRSLRPAIKNGHELASNVVVAVGVDKNGNIDLALTTKVCAHEIMHGFGVNFDLVKGHICFEERGLMSPQKMEGQKTLSGAILEKCSIEKASYHLNRLIDGGIRKKNCLQDV